MFYRSPVLHGSKDGSKNAYPTINLEPTVLPANFKQGVYASKVKIGDKLYFGAAYFGPRLVKQEQHNVLEIYILDFAEVIYGQVVEFSFEAYVRGVIDFTDFSELKAQISSDITQIKKIFNVK
jgi:riboflavin kinase/FMN adenylyltransferase